LIGGGRIWSLRAKFTGPLPHLLGWVALHHLVRKGMGAWLERQSWGSDPTGKIRDRCKERRCRERQARSYRYGGLKRDCRGSHMDEMIQAEGKKETGSETGTDG
jgi:hypothetical protein